MHSGEPRRWKHHLDQQANRRLEQKVLNSASHQKDTSENLTGSCRTRSHQSPTEAQVVTETKPQNAGYQGVIHGNPQAHPRHAPQRECKARC